MSRRMRKVLIVVIAITFVTAVFSQTENDTLKIQQARGQKTFNLKCKLHHES